MDYHYESLLDERFQMFCQSLLLLEYPNLQCMPTRMPDGGRDAFIPRPNREALVFQVKYARDPAKVDDPADWLIAALTKEIPKVKRLQASGMIQRYVLITNMPGSSHLGSGSIDRVQNFLNSHLDMPAQCWWRDDLDRRLDNAFDLKLKYPDLMTGMDAFRLVWTLLGPSEDRSRRENALKAYMSYHYEQDRKVKFKEVGLVSSSLFDLFIDVPITAERTEPRRGLPRGFPAATYRLARIKAEQLGADGSLHMERYEDYGLPRGSGLNYGFFIRTPDGIRQIQVGAAELLLDPTFMESNPAVILEGAPGQGKSTLSQYLMQIHRSRLLELNEEVAALPKFAADSPIMLPVKLELRDLALWVNGIDPWSTRQADSHDQAPTLEAAIAAHIQRYSGGVAFSVADLLAALAETPALVVLDALDEVADLTDRRQVVEEVKAALARLRQRNNQIRFIITSRPTAIAKSPSFRGERLAHLSLAPISHSLAVDYAIRWSRVRALDNKDTKELLNVLNRRLETPHIAELAKNTMQLTILLNLISLRGPSLPDKRTDLYDTYFEVFMDRESEKDASVRDNREFLVDLHTYLGYYLHARAEADRSNGRITTNELQDLIQMYMVKQQQAPDLLPALTGAVDRIFAIVSRVEGMWEFEVQPLQEYFAARYLYDTAPYSPTGRERSGTKPDIFDGIAPNSYWLNVTRFFAGCFSKGELLDLSARLADIVSVESSYVRSLGIALIQDWVFTQSTRATDAVLAAVFDKAGLRWASGLLMFHGSNPSGPDQFTFSRTKEAYAVVDLIWEELRHSPRTAGKLALCHLIRAQNVLDYVLTKWKQGFAEERAEGKLAWLEVGGWLGLLENIPAGMSAELVSTFDEHDRPAATAVVIAANGRVDAMPDELVNSAMKCVFDTEIGLTFSGALDSSINWLASSGLWEALIGALSERDRRYLVEPMRFRVVQCERSTAQRSELIFMQARDIAAHVREITLQEGGDAAQTLDRWSQIVELFIKYFGQSMLSNELAVMSGCIPAGRQRRGPSELFDPTTPLTSRARYAKSQLNQPQWWQRQYSNIQTDYDRHFWLVNLYTWASIDVIAELLLEIETQLALMDEESKAATVAACRRASEYSSRARTVFAARHAGGLRKLRDPAAICMLFDRMNARIGSELLLKYVEPVASTAYMGNAILNFVGKALASGRISDQRALRLMARGYVLGADAHGVLRSGSERARRSISTSLARAIVEDSWNMPPDVLIAAQQIVEEGKPNPEPVMRIAEREGWFGADV